MARTRTSILTATDIVMDREATSHAGERLAFLRLLQLASPALPIGAFAYSQGLEPAVAAGIVHDEATAAAWILGLLTGPLAHQELPLYARMHGAHVAGDDVTAARWNAFLLASRATAELQTEDRQLGASLAKVLATMGLPALVPGVASTLVGQLAWATARFGIDARTALETFAFTWAEAQTSAAVRLVPLGQSAGVRILARAAEAIPGAVDGALTCADDDIAGAAPGLALLSTAHETQYSRLFRS
ncbi:MAG TPA: urease accessory UreF family protein [Polyangia bacterium]|jgi:urease accessory protein